MTCREPTRISKTAHYQTQNGILTVLKLNLKLIIFTPEVIIADGLVALVVLLAVVFPNMSIEPAVLSRCKGDLCHITIMSARASKKIR